jgi:hypothetical protein
VSYESVVRQSAGKIIAVGCWAHARRDFFDARLNYVREAHHVLALIEQLYDIEDEIANRSDAERLAERQARSVPVLNRLEEYLREQKMTVLPQSKFGQAISYALNHWENLLRYATDGALEIDNNRSERTLRPVAIGRKNWMFFGSDRGGETAAICMSIIASAKRHNIEPKAYVTGLLKALSSGDVDLRSLLPDAWIAAHPEHFQKGSSRRGGRSHASASAAPRGPPSEGATRGPGQSELAAGYVSLAARRPPRGPRPPLRCGRARRSRTLSRVPPPSTAGWRRGPGACRLVGLAAANACSRSRRPSEATAFGVSARRWPGTAARRQGMVQPGAYESDAVPLPDKCSAGWNLPCRLTGRSHLPKSVLTLGHYLNIASVIGDFPP